MFRLEWRWQKIKGELTGFFILNERSRKFRASYHLPLLPLELAALG